MIDDDDMTEQERKDERLGALFYAVEETVVFAFKVLVFLAIAALFYHFIGRWW